MNYRHNEHNKHKRTISLVAVFFFTWLSCTLCYPQKGNAESLTISGLQCKTNEFKPYLEKGEFTYFLSQPAAVTVEIQDKEFNLIRKVQFMKIEEAGESVILWDGRDEKGEFIKSWEYILSVNLMGSEGSAVAASMEMKIAFNAPKGTDLKEHVSQIEGKEKKEYPKEVPTKWRSKDKAQTCVRIGMYPIYAIGVIISFPWWLIYCLYEKEKKERIKEFISIFSIYENIDFFGLEKVPNNEKYEKIKKEIDEYSAEIDAEIADENHKIDVYNEKIKDTVTIKVSATE